MGGQKGILARLMAGAAAMAVLLSAGVACAQADPFAALNPEAPGMAAPATVGSTRVETAVGRSYAGSREKGAVSLAQIGFLPKSVPPFQIKVDGSGEKYLSRRPRIAIATYGFGVVRGASASASGAGNGSELAPRRTSVTTFLNGVSDDLAAQLADEAYEDLASRLRAAGFDVVAPAEVMAAPHMQSIGRYPAGTLNGKMGGSAWTTYAPRSAPLIKGYSNETGLAAIAAAGSLISFGKVSQELDAVVLVPRLVVDNVGMQSTGRRNFVGSGSVDAEVRFSVTPATRTDFIWGNERGGSMPGAFTVKGYGSEEPFAVMVKADDRSDSTGLHNALVEAGFGSMYRQSLVYAVQADPNRFAALSRAAFQGYNSALVDAIKRARTS
jgi:hypothetical protein